MYYILVPPPHIENKQNIHYETVLYKTIFFRTCLLLDYEPHPVQQIFYYHIQDHRSVRRGVRWTYFVDL